MDKIIIQYSKENLWTVTVGDKQAVGLCYEEMLGLVAQVTVPEERKALMWLKTKEQQESQNKYFEELRKKTQAEKFIKSNKPTKLEAGEWWFKGRIIQKQSHPKLPNYISFPDKDGETSQSEAHTNMPSAMQYCKKHPVLNPDRTPQDYL